MDIITQGLLGGVMAQAVARKDEKKWASAIGVFSGLIADLDYLIQSSADPLLNIEYHRHFSHSLLFIPVGAAIAFMLLWPFVRQRVNAKRLYLFTLAGYSMSGLLDASTSYGTHLFWPFNDDRVSWHLISIIDPLFTLILLVTLILGFKYRAKFITYAGLMLTISYLSLGYLQLQRAQEIAEQQIHARGHNPDKHVVKPTLGNLFLWRSVYIHDQRIYVDAIRVGLMSQGRVFEGESIPQFIMTNDLPDLDVASVLYQDIVRFITFSDGYVAFSGSGQTVLGDIRYSMLPISIKPLWGIIIDKEQPQQHADYQFFRDNSKQIRETFLKMVLGRCKGNDCRP